MPVKIFDLIPLGRFTRPQIEQMLLVASYLLRYGRRGYVGKLFANSRAFEYYLPAGIALADAELPEKFWQQWRVPAADRERIELAAERLDAWAFLNGDPSASAFDVATGVAKLKAPA